MNPIFRAPLALLPAAVLWIGELRSALLEREQAPLLRVLQGVKMPSGKVESERPRIGRRLPVLERVDVGVVLDPYLSLTGLAGYSGLSVRKLRAHLTDVAHPLPCYRVGGKTLIRRSEFDVWMATFRQRGRVDVNRLVEEVVREVTMPASRATHDKTSVV